MPTPAVQVLELELTEERAKRVRLEQEHWRAKAEADGFAKAKRKLENVIREDKELLAAREKDLARKDVTIQQLQEKVSEARDTVGFQ